MAVRIELFAISGTDDFEHVSDRSLDAAVAAFEAGTDVPDGGAPVRCIGWLSANDEDEDRFTGWCEGVDEDLGTGMLHQGLGESRGLKLHLVPSAHDDIEAGWSATVRDAVDSVSGGRLGWRTNFDQGGTTGTPDDYPTGHRRAHSG